jgi:hypothetical protein
MSIKPRSISSGTKRLQEEASQRADEDQQRIADAHATSLASKRDAVFSESAFMLATGPIAHATAVQCVGQGYVARELGASSRDCPYPPQSDNWREWMNGFHCGPNEAEGWNGMTQLMGRER